MVFFGSKLESRHLLGLILLGAFVIRVVGIGYGLPFHLFSDEEALVFGALKMLEIKSLAPVFHWETFRQLLYYPPFLSYLYLIIFIPALGIKYIVLGFPALSVLKSVLVSDPSLFWYAARFLNVCFAVGNIYLVYQIANLWFKNQRVAVWSALFLVTSFIDVNLSFTARHWTSTLFFSLLALWCVLQALCNQARAKFFSIGAGLSLGVSFGMGYLVFYLPVIGCLYILWGERRLWTVINNLFYFGAAFISVALLAIALHPQPFIQQVLIHTYAPPGVTKQVGVFLSYYLGVLWNYEPILLILSVFGLASLWLKNRKLWGIFVLFYGIVGAIMYVFLWNIPRYLVPLLPFLAMSAAYGINGLVAATARLKLATVNSLTIFLGILFLLYTTVLFTRFSILLTTDDTRISAQAWLENTLASEDSVVVYSGGVRPTPTMAALEAQTKVAPGSLRSAESVYLNKVLPLPPKAINSFSLVFIENREKKEELLKAAAGYPGKHYVVIDSWTKPEATQTELLKSARLVHEFTGSDAEAGSDSPDGTGALFIGGEAHTVTRPMMPLLFTIKQFGPTISIYQLN